MTDTVRVPRERLSRWFDVCVMNGLSVIASEMDAMLAASPQGEGSSADAHPPQPDAPGWRDIATAPRDGTGFLVNCPHVEDGVSMMMWDANLFMMVSLFDGKPWVSGLERPTHWQPLPPPPSADTKRSEPDALPGDLREKIAGIIVRKVLQEDYDDLVEGYLDEILMAADDIILLPAYRAVAEAYYSRLSLIQSEMGGG